tara:strand:- start:5 stop:352 length:348 start_codon:yes stop_codon:yes gene_type:complete
MLRVEFHLNSGLLVVAEVVDGIQVDRLSLVVKVDKHLALVVVEVLVLMQVQVMVEIMDLPDLQLMQIVHWQTLDQVEVVVEKIQIHSLMVATVVLVSLSSLILLDKYQKNCYNSK